MSGRRPDGPMQTLVMRRAMRLLRPAVGAPEASDRELAEIAADVNTAFQHAASHVIAAGSRLLAAKEVLGHGQFERLFMDHPKAIPSPIQCSGRYGRTLMRIAAHPVLSKSEHCSVLPHAVRTLYSLSRLTPEVVERGIEDHIVKPEMQTHDVKLLKEEHPPDTASAEERATRRDRQEKRYIREALRRLWVKFPKHRLYLVNEIWTLLGEVDELRTTGGETGPTT